MYYYYRCKNVCLSHTISKERRPVKVLVINAGSSSLKFQLIDMENEKVLAKGNCERIGRRCASARLSPHGEGGLKFVIANFSGNLFFGPSPHGEGGLK